MSALTWRRISSGHHVSGPYAIRYSQATHRWSLSVAGQYVYPSLGNLRVAKAVAERMEAEGHADRERGAA